MKIETIEIKNYRVFRHVVLDNLPNYVVVVGANGAGKSTLFDVFAFLKESLAHNVTSAVARRGGFRELVSRGQEGPVSITIKFREESGGPLVTYLLEISEVDDRPIIAKEVLKFRRGQHGRPWHFVDFSQGRGEAITNESAYGQENAEAVRQNYALDDPSVLAIKGLGQFREFRIVAEFRNLIENWHVSDFHISDARSSPEIGHAEHLSTRGDNIALVAKHLHEKHPKVFEEILRAMRDRVPGVGNVGAESTIDGRLVLKFEDESFRDPFIARHVSDGTIKMLCYLILLHDPKPHPLLAVEEPENQLYPHLLLELAEEFRNYAGRGQVFVSTHSPDFLDGARLEEIYWLKKIQGYTEAHKVSEIGLLKRMIEEGELPGALWRQKMFEQGLQQ